MEKPFNAFLSLTEIRHAYKTGNNPGAMCYLYDGTDKLRFLSTQDVHEIKTEDERSVRVR